MTTATQHSSGDFLADRRADYARMLAGGGDFASAMELMQQALELAPRWAAGWFRLSEYAEKSGLKEAAAAGLAKVLDLAPADPFGAGLKIAVLGGSDVPAGPPSRYVEQLFDDYAERFDTALVERLEYSVPEKLATLIFEHIPSARFSSVADLGCGTGLFGTRIRERAAFLEGFDLSANMLAKAREKQVYDRLAQADLSLSPSKSGVFGPDLPPNRAELVSAADVLMYLGELTTPFSIAATLVATGGYFAFSAEDAGADEGYVLRSSLRYAHGEAYVRDRAAAAGFDVLLSQATVIRKDAGDPVHGRLFLARRRT